MLIGFRAAVKANLAARTGPSSTGTSGGFEISAGRPSTSWRICDDVADRAAAHVNRHQFGSAVRDVGLLDCAVHAPQAHRILNGAGRLMRPVAGTAHPGKAVMPTLRIEHTVPDYENWKRAFDSDPADRKGSGVRRYQINRAVAEPNLVSIDLDFDDVASAEALLATMQRIWAGPAAGIMVSPRATIVQQVESVEL
jgi:hypothetical protein